MNGSERPRVGAMALQIDFQLVYVDDVAANAALYEADGVGESFGVRLSPSPCC